MMARLHILVAMLGLTASMVWAAGVALPHSDGFESDTAGTAPAGPAWAISGTPSPNVQVSVVPSGGGFQACSVSNETALTYDVNDAKATNVWVQIYAKPSFYDDSSGSPAVPAASAGTAVFYINTNRILYAYGYLGSTNGWTNVISSLPTNTWIGFGLHIDYANTNWDLYVSTAGSYGGVMTKANASPITFYEPATSRTAFDFLTITNETYVDEVAGSYGFQAVGSGSRTYLVTRAMTAVSTNLIGIRGYDYGASENTLGAGSRLADNLRSGLSAGDEVWIYYTNSWQRYELDNNGVWVGVAATVAAADMHIERGTGLRIVKSSTTNAVAFFPYTTVVSPVNITVCGTNMPGRGWNLYAWPHTTSRSVSAQYDVGFDQKVTGDLIYIYNANGSLIRLLNYNAAVGYWREGRTASTYTMTDGQPFWYYSGRDGTSTWNVARF